MDGHVSVCRPYEASVFETTIRVVGGMLAAFELSNDRMFIVRSALCFLPSVALMSASNFCFAAHFLLVPIWFPDTGHDHTNASSFDLSQHAELHATCIRWFILQKGICNGDSSGTAQNCSSGPW